MKATVGAGTLFTSPGSPSGEQTIASLREAKSAPLIRSYGGQTWHHQSVFALWLQVPLGTKRTE